MLKYYDYSLKNIPIPSKNSYFMTMLEKVESFIRRIRWKAYFFEKGPASEGRSCDDARIFGFKSSSTPPQSEHLNQFENDLYEMVRNIECKPVRSKFLTRLDKDLRDIRSSTNVFVFADKTRNVYELSKDAHNRLLSNNITKTYRKCCSTTKRDIDEEARELSKHLDLDKGMEQYAERNAFITLKDHKDNFTCNLPCRIINPSKK